MRRGLSLYIHIPFCLRKCAYCDFCSFPGEMQKTDAYIGALEKELRRHGEAAAHPSLRTLYIGGGTPTALTAEQIARVLRAVGACFSMEPHAEATIEANPGTLDAEKLDACVRGGINRLSMGMQAKSPRLLRTLGRIHDFSQVETGVRMARAAGVKNVSVDLMYALPGQTVSEWDESLCAALSLGIEHLSCYELTLEEGTPLHERVQSGELHVPEEDTCLEMAELARRRTREAGMHRYEISNYAREGFESIHNQAYWECAPYIGAGCAAHGYTMRGGFPGVRYANTDDLDAYIAGEGTPRERTPLTEREARFERLMLSLRMVRGMDLARFERDFHQSVHAAFGKKLDALIGQGLLKEQDGFLFCTTRGMDVQSAVLVELMDEGAGESAEN